MKASCGVRFPAGAVPGGRAAAGAFDGDAPAPL